MKQVSLASLVLDFKLYPRHEVTSHVVTEMCEAHNAGIEFPPLVVDKKSRRVIDGFKRHRMYERLKLDKAPIVEKTYKSEAAMFLDAVRYNSQHGQALDAFDRAHCVILAANLGIDDKAIAGALCVTVERVNGLRTNKSAKVGTLSVALKSPLRHMAGKKLTKKQAETNEKMGGMGAAWLMRQLTMLIEAELLDPEDEKMREEAKKLATLLAKWLNVK